MSVRIGLDYAVEPASLRQHGLEQPNVGGQQVEVDLDPGSSGERRQRASRSGDHQGVSSRDNPIARGAARCERRSRQVAHLTTSAASRAASAISVSLLRASGNSGGRSDASNPASPSRARTASPAMPCRYTPSWAASKVPSP